MGRGRRNKPKKNFAEKRREKLQVSILLIIIIMTISWLCLVG